MGLSTHHPQDRKTVMQTYQFYRVDKHPPVGWVSLNRPDKKNAMNPPAWQEAPSIFADLDRDAAIRVVVLAAEGPSFSVGIDLLEMATAVPEITAPRQGGGVKWRLLERIRQLQETMNCIARCRKPVIAAIQGHCFGAGLDMAAACDVRLCSRDALFALKETAVGFVADVGVLQRLPLIIGQGLTREMALCAEPVGAERAERIGLVNAVFESPEALREGAAKMAQTIAANPPLAVQASKDVLNQAIEQPIAEGLRYAASLSANIVPSDDLLEALASFAEKRAPRFSGQ